MSIREHSRKSVTLITGISLLFGDFFVPLQLMKRASYIFLIVLMLAACGGWRDGQRLLDRADSLLYGQPDSALRLLDSITEDDQERMSEAQLMRYHLLRADAQNKCFVPFTTDSVMKEVAHYYERKGTPNEQMRAYYLLGRAYYDMGETPMALKYFHEAADCADTTQADCDFKLLSRVHGQMGRLFLDQGAPRNALDELDDAQHCALACGDTLMYISSYSFKGSAYEYLNMADSALDLKRAACRLYERHGYEEEAAKCMVPVLDILVEKGNMQEAARLMSDYERSTGILTQRRDIPDGKKIYLGTKGYYYLKAGKLDSALFFFRRLLVNATTTNHYECGYAGMSKAFHQLGLQDSAYYYASLAYSYNDSCHREQSTLDYQRNHSVFNYTRYQQTAERKTKEATVNRIMWIVASSAFLLLLATSLIILFFSRNKAARQMIKQQEMSIRISELERLNKEITASRDELDLMLRIKMKNAITCGEVTTFDNERWNDEKSGSFSNEMFEDLIELKKQSIEEKKSSYQLLLESTRQADSAKNAEQVLKEMPVIANLKKKTIVKGSSLMNESQWEELKESIDKAFPVFPRFLFGSCPRLRLQERKVLYLTKAFFSTGEISLLTGLSKNSVSMMKSRLIKKIFGIDGGAKDLEKRLSQL